MMLNSELFVQLKQLSRGDKFQIIQFLIADFAQKEGLKLLDNNQVDRTLYPHNYSDAADKLMSLLEQKEGK
ncbi:MAG: hypothetical protein F6K24_57855 [Okeania sp. SIO2D1]|uniref:hypothetical protein n=1 Tax=Okeania sp. SIO2C9 TaxID=2607791 RepID=UPI0013B75339|nr:hypothetical protein [Okeania sp. SIO2C9]NEQ76990.1 hypothetical protein [Okeania sp. SIO2C9]NES74184.1 hypothetical protein [Okeania sp. SIO2D1]